MKVHADGSNSAGAQALQAMGRTKGGLNTKIHALVNVRSQALVIALSAGNQADVSFSNRITLTNRCGAGYRAHRRQRFIRA